MSDSRFFHNLPAIHTLSEVTNPTHYHNVPDDWFIALTDIRGSTKAIAAGRYKEVNGIAAATITAMLNTLPDIELPFVFGGDGATILIPPDAVFRATRALQATRNLARDQFSLDLRIGIVPVADVQADGYAIRVTKLQMSKNFQQAIFSGGGLAYADKLLKDPELGAAYSLEALPEVGEPPEADFSGFECRWDEMPGPRGETISLMVMARGSDEERSNQIYREVIHSIDDIYGNSAMRHPIALDNMRVGQRPSQFRVETGIRQNTTAFFPRLKLMLYAWGGYFLWKYRTGIWERYKQTVMGATDHEKFDDTLRMIMSGSTEQRLQLDEYLNAKFQMGQLVYGIHVSNRALMTCVVFDRFGRQVHFLDGADGGYALAARDMKAQLAQSNEKVSI
jgi:hypothetical protein